jgi:hypothetical protein
MLQTTTIGHLLKILKRGLGQAIILNYETGKKNVSEPTDAVSKITTEANSEVYGESEKQPKKAAATTQPFIFNDGYKSRWRVTNPL